MVSGVLKPLTVLPSSTDQVVPLARIRFVLLSFRLLQVVVYIDI